MKWIKWWKKNQVDEDVLDLEKKLQSTLVAVNPRQEFVDDLRRKLMKQVSEIDLALEPNKPKFQNGLLIAGGVLGALSMVLTGVRGLISVIGVIGLLISALKHNTNETPVSSNFAH